MWLYCTFQAVTSCKLEVTTLPVLCRELIAEWKNVVRYLTTHAPLQEGQGSRGRVRSHLFSFKSHGNIDQFSSSDR